MANPFSKIGLTDAEFREALANAAEVDAGLQQFMAKEVVPYWKSIAPVDEGEYAASIKVARKARRGKGAVRATDYKAAWIEFGTGAPGPTRAHATGQRVAQHFGGNLDSGIDAEGDR